MGFNKRFVNRKGILTAWENEGIEGLHSYFSADALLINLECIDLTDLYFEREFEYLEKLISEELIKSKQ
jgi:hypothetical protein